MKTAPFPLYVTDGASSFESCWLEIHKNQALEQFYDAAVRSNFYLEPVRMYKDATKLTVLDEYDDSSIEISLNRTLRVPEDGTVYNHPALFGPFPLLNVDLLRDKLPDTMARKSGLLISMFQREALSVGFQSAPRGPIKNRKAAPYRRSYDRAFAIKVLAGSVNVVSGSLGDSRGQPEDQDYVVAPYQSRVDGFFAKAGVNIVRQFVAMPTFAGYTAEGQLKGEEEFGGIQLVIAPRFAGRGEFRHGPSGRALDRAQQRSSPASLGLRTGHVLFVSGTELEQRFQDVFCTGEDALCTGPDFFISDHSAIERQRQRQWQRCVDIYANEACPYPDSERPVMIHELLAATVREDCHPGEPLVLEPVFRMTITIKSRHSREFCAAKGKLYIGDNPSILGFMCDRRRDDNPISVTWRVSPFMSLEQLFCLVRIKFDCQAFALFHRHQQIEEGAYAALHTIFEDGATIWFQAYRYITKRRTGGKEGSSIERLHPEEAKTVSPWEMGLTLGGEIYQDICVDSEPEWWNWQRSQLVNIQILNAVSFKSFTGFDAPPPPLSFREYVNARLPFFHLIPQSALKGSEIIAKLKSVGQNDLESVVANRDTVLDGLTPVACLICQENLADTM